MSRADVPPLCDVRRHFENGVLLSDWWAECVSSGRVERTKAATAGGSSAEIKYRIEKRSGLRYLRSLPMSPAAGPRFEHPANLSSTSRAAAEIELTMMLLDSLPTADFARLRLCPSVRSPYAFQRAGWLVTHGLTHVIPLAGMSDEALLKQMASDERRKLKRASSRFTILLDAPFSSHASLISERLDKKRARHSVSEEMLSNAARAASANDSFFLTPLAVDADGLPVGAAVFVGNKSVVHYVVGGVAPGVSDAGRFVLWEGIRQSLAFGTEVFDFEGSSLPTVEPLFRRLGGVVQPTMVATKFGRLLAPMQRVRTLGT